MLSHRAANDESSHAANVIRSMQSTWRVKIPVNNFRQNSAIDPFVATVVPITNDSFSILRYARQSMSIGAGGYRIDLFPDSLRPMEEMYQAATEHVFQNLVGSKHVILPVLAAFSRRLNVLGDGPSMSSVKMDWYLHLAIRAVRESIMEVGNNQESLNQIATGVHYLICSTALGGRLEESKVHLRGFLKFLPYIDTKSLVGYWELDVASSLDLLSAIATADEPIFKIATSDPGPLPPLRKLEIQHELASIDRENIDWKLRRKVNPAIEIYHNKVSDNHFDMMLDPATDIDLKLGTGLEYSVTSNRLHPSMSSALHKFLDCLMVAKFIWRAPESASRKDTQWLCQRSRAVLHELLSLNRARKMPDSTVVGRYSECLRLTISIYLTASLYRVFRLSRRRLTIQLQKALSKLMHEEANDETGLIAPDEKHFPRNDADLLAEPPDRQDAELLLWMFFTGFWAADESLEANWFARPMLDVAVNQLHLSSLAGLEEVMLRHLYSKTAQQGSLARIADMIPG